MTAEAIDPANLTPAQMDRLRAEFQSTGMTLIQATEGDRWPRA
ncbi:hypothetical protein [Falsiroseomonas sp. E2-1-a20]